MTMRAAGDLSCVTMVCHPTCRPGAVDGIEARVVRAPESLAVLLHLEGRLDRLVIPQAAAPGRRDGLWRTTCFEVFMRRAGDAGYAEFNVSPSGAWAAYRFDGYRDGMRDLELAGEPGAEIRRGDGRLDVALRLAALPDPWGRAQALRIGVGAVIEETGGTLSYWALAHPPGVPDFHHAAGFVLEVRLAELPTGT